MTAGRSVKGCAISSGLVAVIGSTAELHRATRLRRLPDLFELRLDGLQPLSSKVEQIIAKLARPLIITARHPLEGGQRNLSSSQRRQLLLRFLPQAAFVDVELRSSTRLHSVLEAAKTLNTRRILSVHELRRTPPTRDLVRLAHLARKLSADVFKIVTRTDTPAELARLIDFFEDQKRYMPISVMGVGKLGRASRVALMQCGSVLNYAHLGGRLIEGQFSLAEARRSSAGARGAMEVESSRRGS